MALREHFAVMATGAMYDDLASELIAAREEAVLPANAYNAAFGRLAAEREALLAELLGEVGPGAHLEPTMRVEFGRNISLGARFYANFDCVMLDGAPVRVGDNVLFGPRVGIYTQRGCRRACCARSPRPTGPGLRTDGRKANGHRSAPRTTLLRLAYCHDRPERREARRYEP